MVWERAADVSVDGGMLEVDHVVFSHVHVMALGGNGFCRLSQFREDGGADVFQGCIIALV
jgi:hypothetical protein